MNRRLYSSFLIGLLICISFVSASFNDASNMVLDKQVSGGFGKLTQTLFKTTDLSLENVIILYVIFIVIFLVLENVIAFIPMFNSKTISMIMAFLVSVLISISGAYSLSSRELFGIMNSFSIENWSLLVLLVVLAIVLIVGILLWLVSNNLQRWKAKSDAHDSGLKLGTDSGFAKTYSGISKNR